MSDENKEPVDLAEEKRTETPTSDPHPFIRWMDSMGTRQYVVQLVAGLYLLYTGYSLCKGVVAGDAGVGFMICGILFILIGGFMTFVGGRGLLIVDKKRREEQEKAFGEGASGAQAGASASSVQNSEDTAKKNPEGKTMSIAERAKLTSRLDDPADPDPGEEEE